VDAAPAILGCEAVVFGWLNGIRNARKKTLAIPTMMAAITFSERSVFFLRAMRRCLL